MSAFMHRLAENQVVDAGALEGYTAAELSSDGYSVFRDIEEPVGNGPSSQTVVELSGLPAGSYIIVAKTLMRNAAGTSNVTCELVAAPDFDRVIATVPSAYYVPMTMTVVHTFADNDGSAVLQCQDGATSIMSSWSKISAISVDSLSNSSG
jgi:hypothetical protein